MLDDGAHAESAGVGCRDSFTMPSATAWLGVFTPGLMSRPLLKLEQPSQDGTRGPQSVVMKTPTVNGR